MSGVRARRLVDDGAAQTALARRLQKGMQLGELFSSMSGLYFRGKLAYATAYATPPRNVSGTYVITASGGLLTPETCVNGDQLRGICAADIDCSNRRYVDPLERDLLEISNSGQEHCEFVLLGSIATPKYVDPLLRVLGLRLFFPLEFAGRGDLSRGSLLLRCVREGTQLTYVPVLNGPRHSTRPGSRDQLRRQVSH